MQNQKKKNISNDTSFSVINSYCSYLFRGRRQLVFVTLNGKLAVKGGGGDSMAVREFTTLPKPFSVSTFLPSISFFFHRKLPDCR